MRTDIRLAFVLVAAGLLALSVHAPLSRSSDPPAAAKGAEGAETAGYQKALLPFLKRHCFF